MPLLLIRKLWIARQADRAVTFGLLCLGSDKNSNNITETVARLSLNSTLYQTQPKFQLELNWGSNPLECDCSTWSGNEQSNLTKTVTTLQRRLPGLNLNSTLDQTQPKFQLELNWGSNPLECDCSTWSGNEQVGQWKPPSEILWLVRGAIELSDFIQKTFVTAPWCRLLTEISEYGHWGASWLARQYWPHFTIQRISCNYLAVTV